MEPYLDKVSPLIKTIVVFTILLLLAGGIWFYRTQERIVRQKAEEDLTAIGRLKVDQIVRWRNDQLKGAAEMQQHPFLLENVVRFLDTPNENIRKDLLIRFRNLAELHNYSNILLVDPGGKVRLSLTNLDIHKGYESVLANVLHDRKPVFTNMHTETKEGQPHISVVAPLFADSEQSSSLIGSLVLVNNASQFLYPLIQFWPAPSKTAETILVTRDGDHVLFLNELRHQTNTALKLRIPLSQTDVPAVMAIQGKTGFLRGKDYRGVEVASMIMPIPDSSWFMITKVDAAEVYSEWRFQSILILSLLAGLTAFVGVSGLVVLQREKKVHYRALYFAESLLRANVERHSVTLKAIGDAVIAADARGIVELLNPVAELLTGWTGGEAEGKPLEEIFCIINEETREKVESPVGKVLREGVVVGLANHTILVARDGTERCIADSGAPIRDADGTITGVVLVFRDQTAEYAAQKDLAKSEERLQLALNATSEALWDWDLPSGVVYRSPHYDKLVACKPEEDQSDFEFFKNTVHPDDLSHVLETIEKHKKGMHAAIEVDCRLASYSEDTRWLRIKGGVVSRAADGAPLRMVGTLSDITEQKQNAETRAKLERQVQQLQRIEAIGQLAGGVAHDFNNMLGIILGHAELAMAEIDQTQPTFAHLREIQDAAKRSADITRQLLAFARKQTITPREIDLNATIAGMLKMLRRLIGEDIDLAWMPGFELWQVKVDPSQVDQILANLCVNARDAISGVGKITVETENRTFDEDYCRNYPDVVPGEYVMLSVSDTGVGMSKETMAHIFEPFFTTKVVGEGTGLGLATVFGAIKQNNGFINVYSEPGQGTTFRIYLPRFVNSSEKVRAEQESKLAVGGNEIILLVEDERKNLEMISAMLEKLGYSVIAASGPREAIQLMEEITTDINLLITDVIMPEMNGWDLAERLLFSQLGMKCLFMSGYTADIISKQGVLAEGVNFIQKPFSKNELATKIREVLEG
ncbi:MAG: ATP-binding protein [Pseudomonadota bacterium]